MLANMLAKMAASMVPGKVPGTVLAPVHKEPLAHKNNQVHSMAKHMVQVEVEVVVQQR